MKVNDDNGNKGNDTLLHLIFIQTRCCLQVRTLKDIKETSFRICLPFGDHSKGSSQKEKPARKVQPPRTTGYNSRRVLRHYAVIFEQKL